jgi:hypothetical protein
MKRRLGFVAVAVVAGIALTGCNTTESPSHTETTIDYKGRPLDCITWDGSHGEVGMTCDFVGYHEQSSSAAMP